MATGCARRQWIISIGNRSLRVNRATLDRHFTILPSSGYRSECSYCEAAALKWAVQRIFGRGCKWQGGEFGGYGEVLRPCPSGGWDVVGSYNASID